MNDSDDSVWSAWVAAIFGASVAMLKFGAKARVSASIDVGAGGTWKTKPTATGSRAASMEELNFQPVQLELVIGGRSGA